MMLKSRIEIILDNTPFPGAGQEIGGYKVNESVVDIKGKNWAIYLQGKLSPTQVKQALSSLTGKHFALPVEEEFSLIRFDSKGMTHARTNPPGDVTVVRGHMYYARPNPISAKDFQAEMDEMLIDDSEKFFTKYTVKTKTSFTSDYGKELATLENPMDGRKATTSTTVGLHSSCRKSKSIRLSRELLCFTTLIQQKMNLV